MKKIISAILILCSITCLGQRNKTFEKPFYLKADGKAIDLSTHTCPYIYDFNKDGKDDLLVGDFGRIYCPGVDRTKPHAYVQARCHIFLNKGTVDNPVYDKERLLMAGGVPAYVPNT